MGGEMLVHHRAARRLQVVGEEALEGNDPGIFGVSEPPGIEDHYVFDRGSLARDLDHLAR